MLFLLMIQAEKRLIVLTKKDMYNLCQKEKKEWAGSLEIEFIHAKLPENLADLLKEAKRIAVTEVSPREEFKNKMTSTISWLDFSETERRKMIEVVSALP